ncbi:uncharacterized protein [Panulirus ornatus]|uniref:uncharacterized protein isoform X2 n=1 Tax=Panulirus ornatus TaxID=150431 RepID=UPI003A846625
MLVLVTEFNVDRMRIVVSHQYKFIPLTRWLRPYRWYFVCINHDRGLNQVTTSLDGRSLKTHNLSETLPQWATEVTVGYVDSLDYTVVSFIGEVTQFNLWSRVLPQEEVSDLAMCRSLPRGDVISWDREWEVQDVVEYEVDSQALCYHEKPPRFQVFPPMTYNEGCHLCEALGGFIPTPRNWSDVRGIYSEAQRLRPECKMLWVGIEDEADEGQWVYHYNGRPAYGIPWADDEPNGLHYENCGALDAVGVVDEHCPALSCTCCVVPPDIILTMKGSCETHVRNLNYMMKYDKDTRVFVGYGDYKILHDGARWVWLNHQSNETMAHLQPSKYDYPMGRKWWHLDEPLCDQESGEVRRLLLSVCEEHQYTCDDGTCVDLTLRCDLKYDCRDNSDEADCLLVRLPPDYKTNVAPRLPKRSVDNEALEVAGLVSLSNLRVDTSEMLLKVAFGLTLVWTESRTTYVNLKSDPSLNLVDSKLSEVWRPTVVLLNTVDTTHPSSSKHASPSLTYVLRRGTHTGTDNSIPEEVRLFPGRDNPLVEKRKYQASFTCEFDLTRYPFDEQTCYLGFHLGADSSEDLRWDSEASWAEYEGSELLLEYTVGPVSLRINTSVLKVRVPLARRVGYAVINIYVPSLTMLAISYLTLFFKRDNFEVRVMTSLTTLLVMATLFSQVAASLPKTSYFKLVDIWLLFCIFSTFFIIVFHILIDAFLHEAKKRNRLETNELSVMPPTSEKVFLPSTSKALVQSQQQPHHQHHHQDEGAPQKPAGGHRNGDVSEDMMTLEVPMNDMTCRRRRLLVHRLWKLRMSVRSMEKLARMFMVVVFMVFNLVYWLIAYIG